MGGGKDLRSLERKFSSTSIQEQIAWQERQAKEQGGTANGIVCLYSGHAEVGG